MAKNFSIWHFPLLLGVISYATVEEEAIAHPDRLLSFEGRILFALGLLLFLGTIGLALWGANANASIFLPRLGFSVMLAVIILLVETETIFTMLLALTGILLLLVIENKTISLHSEDLKIT